PQPSIHAGATGEAAASAGAAAEAAAQPAADEASPEICASATPPAEARPEEGQPEDEQHEEQVQQGASPGPASALGPRRRRGLRQLETFAGSRPHQHAHRPLDPGGELALPEGGDQHLADDAGRLRVRDATFEAIAHLDADLAVLLGDEQQQPLVLFLTAELPFLDHTDREIFQRVAL